MVPIDPPAANRGRVTFFREAEKTMEPEENAKNLTCAVAPEEASGYEYSLIVNMVAEMVVDYLKTSALDIERKNQAQ